MATQKVRPARVPDEPEQAQRRQVSRTIMFGTIAIAAIVGAIAVLIAVVAVGPGGETASTAVIADVGGGGGGPDASATASPTSPLVGLPPDGVTPSRPLRGNLIKQDTQFRPWHATYLYADGRLISAKSNWRSYTASAWVEQRLTPGGVRLLRSASSLDTDGLPANAWEDSDPKPYVASRYAVRRSGPGVVRVLPPAAQDLLSAARTPAGNFRMTTQNARALTEILGDRGFNQTPGDCTSPGVISYVRGDLRWHLRIDLAPVLPDGQAFMKVCG